MAKSAHGSHKELVTVYIAGDLIEARMVQEVLKRAGIESILHGEIGETFAGVYGMTTKGWAAQEIQVLEANAEEAQRILSELPKPDQRNELA